MKTSLLAAVASLALLLTIANQASAQRSTMGSSSRSMGSSFTPGNRTAIGGQSGLSDISTAGQIQGRERYLRQNRSPGQFVGADAQEVNQILRNFSALAGRNPRLNRNLRSPTAPAQPVSPAPGVPFQARLEAAFEHTQPNVQATSQRIAARLQGARGIKSSGPIQVVFEGDTAVLRGQVATARDRLLAEQLARFEPGVWRLRNEITLAESK